MATLPLPAWLAPKTAPALIARHARWLPTAANVLLVLLVARLAAALLWSLMPQPAAAAWRPAPAPAATVRNDAQTDLVGLASANLFGVYKPPAAGKLDVDGAPDTQLNLTLLGIWANTRDAKNSFALIGAQGGDEAPYRVGDDLSRGVTLQAIFQDRVILLRNGKPEALRLDKDAPGQPLLPGATPVANVAAGSDASQSLTSLRAQLLNDPSKVSDFIRVQPVNNGGALSGYRIYPGKDRAVFNAAGLKPGDVVTSINGQPLNDPAKALQLLSDLSSTNQLNLVIDRGGQSQNVSVNLNN